MTTKISGTGFNSLTIDELVLTTPLAEQYGGSGSTGVYKMEYATPKSATGTFVDFTGIPSWAKRITVMFSGVSTNGTSNYQIQVGNGSVVTAGYSSSASSGANGSTSTTGIVISAVIASATLYNISVSLFLVNSSNNSWLVTSTGGTNSSNAGNLAGGIVALNSFLDIVRITTVNGTDLFDAGTINVMWEGFA